eukprot:42391-Pleurochrysis_carterae.AAC.3
MWTNFNCGNSCLYVEHFAFKYVTNARKSQFGANLGAIACAHGTRCPGTRKRRKPSTAPRPADARPRLDAATRQHGHSCSVIWKTALGFRVDALTLHAVALPFGK